VGGSTTREALIHQGGGFEKMKGSRKMTRSRTRRVAAVIAHTGRGESAPMLPHEML
jgi:hypothetical protein